MNGHGEIWTGIKFFHPDSKVDTWGDTHKITRPLLEELDAFRAFVGVPIIVTSGYREKKRNEQSDSQHAYGQAADIVAPDYKGPLFDLYLAASRFGFKGIGLYPHWFYRTVDNVIGGLHLDVRKSTYRAQWLCYKDDKGKQQYTTLDHATLKAHGVL
jgi:uncharacterized protein YcbK (DUF882 family)